MPLTARSSVLLALALLFAMALGILTVPRSVSASSGLRWKCNQKQNGCEAGPDPYCDATCGPQGCTCGSGSTPVEY